MQRYVVFFLEGAAMALQSENRMTVEEYLRMERASEEKHEFRNGLVYSTPPVDVAECLIRGNVLAAIHGQLLDRGCEALTSQMRVKVPERGWYLYPDVLVVCDPPILEDDFQDTLLNPMVIVEVLSEATEADDRGIKFDVYRSLESIREYLMVHKDTVHVEQFVRREVDSWDSREWTSIGDVIPIDSIGCTLGLKRAYEKVNLDRK
jgi:Uma2 family endonuclease